MFRPTAKIKIAEELARGEAAREAGLEGRARVCARRAAGAAIREYLELRGLTPQVSSAYDLLVEFQRMPEIPADWREAAEALLARVDESFSLPEQVDLLAQARWLAQQLEAQS